MPSSNSCPVDGAGVAVLRSRAVERRGGSAPAGGEPSQVVAGGGEYDGSDREFPSTSGADPPCRGAPIQLEVPESSELLMHPGVRQT